MNKQNTGTLAIISGFSGAGKGTVMKELMRRYADEFCLSISATTRESQEKAKWKAWITSLKRRMNSRE